MSELQEAIQEMRNMRESYDQIAGAAEAYNTGKVQLADNITAKGVQASATETLPELADKVSHIAHEYVTIDGGEQYETQMFGGTGAASPIWNLYDVLAQMKNTYLDSPYKGIIVCEYYRIYDQLQLQGADAYYTCDGDFYDYDALHTWHDYNNGKANRWICFMYKSESGVLNITDTSIAPLSIYIGGTIGEINQFVAGRLTDFVCGIEDRDRLLHFNNQGYSNPFSRTTILNGIEEFKIADGNNSPVAENNNIVIFSSDVINIIVNSQKNALTFGQNVIAVYLQSMQSFTEQHQNAGPLTKSLIEIIDMRSLTTIKGKFRIGTNTTRLIDVWVGEMVTMLNFSDWNPTNVLADANKKSQLIDNIKNHILARVSDATGGTQLVFTVSTNMYNNIASEQIEWKGETMSLADAFLTKNWLLAGA